MLKKIFISVFFLIFATGCSGNPGESILQKELQKALIKPWIIESLNIAAEENIGSKTEPVYKYRLIVDISPSEALYERVGSLMDTSIIKLLRNKGEEKQFHVIATTIYKNGEWEFLFKPESNPFEGEGLIGSYWSTKYVVKDSSEHKKLIAQAKERIAKDSAQVEQMKRDIDVINEKYKAAQLKFDEVKNEFDPKINIANEEKNKKIEIVAKNMAIKLKEQKKNEFSISDERFKLEKKERVKIDTAASKKFQIEDIKFREKISKVRGIQRVKTREIKTKYQKILKEAKTSLSETEFKAFKIKSNSEHEAEVDVVDKEYEKNFTPIREQQQKLEKEYKKIHNESYKERQVNDKKRKTDLDAALKECETKISQEKLLQISEIEKPYIAIKAEFSKKSTPYRSEMELLKEQRDQLNASVGALNYTIGVMRHSLAY